MSDLNVGKPPKLSPIKRDILDIVRGAQRNGATDLTAMEIQRIYEERIKNGRMSDGYFAGRVSELVAAGHLLRSANKQDSVLAQIPALLAELRNELAADDAQSSAGEPLMSVPAAVVIADEIDFWSNSGGQVIIDPNCREVVDLIGQPAVAPVPHPDSESAILACGNV